MVVGGFSPDSASDALSGPQPGVGVSSWRAGSIRNLGRMRFPRDVGAL